MASELPTVETIDRILGLAPAKTFQIDGFTYIDKDKKAALVMPAVPEALKISTLSGFIDLLEASFEKFPVDEVLVQIASHEAVKLIQRSSDRFGRRQAYIYAELMKAEREFQFNTFLPQENFVINLRSLFIQDSQLDDLVRLAGNLAQNSEIRQEDDGFTQRATVKSGVVMVNERTVLPRVTLTPFRTFREAVQPSSEFVFRVKHDERLGNMCALFEADGGTWKLQAIQNVKQFISNQLKGADVQGLPDIPVIA